MKPIAEYKVEGQYPVRLYQYKRGGKLKIIYGACNYFPFDQQAAAQCFGECVLHALTCAGKLDNE